MMVGLVGSLAVVLGAFSMSFQPGSGLDIQFASHDPLKIEHVEQTVMRAPPPPPPPAPPPPIAVPDDAIIELAPIMLDIDPNTFVARTPPPPPSPPPPPTAAPPPPPPPPPVEPEIFEVVEQMPELIGGLEALQRTIRYPEIARLAGLEGRVFIMFIVDEQGRVVDPIVARGIGGGCDEAALAAVRNARFRPGVQRGRAVKVRYSLPIVFRLN